MSVRAWLGSTTKRPRRRRRADAVGLVGVPPVADAYGTWTLTWHLPPDAVEACGCCPYADVLDIIEDALRRFDGSVEVAPDLSLERRA
jgi:hypothetical protein